MKLQILRIAKVAVIKPKKRHYCRLIFNLHAQFQRKMSLRMLQSSAHSVKKTLSKKFHKFGQRDNNKDRRVSRQNKQAGCFARCQNNRRNSFRPASFRLLVRTSPPRHRFSQVAFEVVKRAPRLASLVAPITVSNS